MEILVINGSPRDEQSNTLKLTRAFAEGIGDTFDCIDTMKVDVKPCLGCYACWRTSPGKCIQQDDMANILDRILASDLVIWSTPLYCYSVPSNCKAFYERLMPFGTMEQKVGSDGGTYHPGRQNIHTQIMLICGCGFPNRENNVEAMDFQFDRMFSPTCPWIYSVESPLLGIFEAKPVADRYLAFARQAGTEFKKSRRITAETQAQLDAPMIPPDVYRAEINAR